MYNPIFDSGSNNVQKASAPPASSTGIVQYFKSNYDVDSAREVLSAYPNNWPKGLQDCFVDNLNRIPFRFFICDDSGSVSHY